MVIVGWALDHRGCLPNMTKQIEQFHQTHFGGVHQTLFLMDTLEKEETFFSIRNGHLYRREGFYIYYDRHAAVKLKRWNTGKKNRRSKSAGDRRGYIHAAGRACLRHKRKGRYE